MLKNRKLVATIAIIVGILAIASIVFAVRYFGKQEVSTAEPVDVAYDYYRAWLDAAHSTTTDPYQAGLAKWPYLSKELRTRIGAAQNAEGGLDPVLCQSELPEDFALRIVSQSDTTSEMLVTARRSSSTEQAIITALPLDGGWYISDIRCSPGEFGPEREFSFEAEGSLLKSVPEPLNPEYWHLVYAQDGEPGYQAPLFFGPESTCVALDGSAGACNPESFVEAAKARVQGQMTDLGVNVTRLELQK